MNRVEQLKAKMAEGKLLKGFFLTMADPMISEIAGYAGYDYVWIDAEHGPLDRQEIFHHVVAAQGAGCAAFVRVPGVDRKFIKAILDMGPDAIIFPFVNNAEIAEELVKSCSYADFGGVRGQGPIRAIRYGFIDENEYIQTAYERVLKIAQVETIEGYDNLDAIMDTQGIDSIFIGAADMSRSVAGSNGERNLDSIYNDICRRVKEKGKYLGVAIGPNKADAKRVKDLGADWIVFGQDVRIIADGLKHNLDELAEF